MRFYLDTSLLVSALTREATTERNLDWIVTHLGEGLAVSWWVIPAARIIDAPASHNRHTGFRGCNFFPLGNIYSNSGGISAVGGFRRDRFSDSLPSSKGAARMFHGPPDHRARLLGNGTAIMHAAPEYQPPT